MAVVPGRARPLFPRGIYASRIIYYYATRREPQGGGALEEQHALQPCPYTVTAQSVGKRRKERDRKKRFSFPFAGRRRAEGDNAERTLVLQRPAHAPQHPPRIILLLSHPTDQETPLRPLQLTWCKEALNHI